MRFVVVALLAVTACADDTPSSRTPNQARPMDEPRAQGVIAHTFQAEAVEAEGGRTFALSVKDAPKLAVAAQGHKYGVIWLTHDLQTQLSAFLPKHENDEALVVLDGAGVDSGGHALVLWDSDYVTDDLSGVSHSSTQIAAERKLERDVRDFLLKAKNEQWP